MSTREASADWAADGTRSSVVAMVNRTGAPKTAAGALRKTGLLAASMPHVSTAAAAGALPLSHLRLLTGARKDDVAEVFDRDEEMLVAEARTLTADALEQRLVAWRWGALEELERNDTDNPPDHDSDADTARIIRGIARRGLVTLDLTPESLAVLVEAVEARIETWRRTGQLTEDTRTYEELVGAAVMDLIADGSTSSRRGVPRPLLIVTATLRELFDRAGTPADQRADVHHIRWWRNGGLTDINNLTSCQAALSARPRSGVLAGCRQPIRSHGVRFTPCRQGVADESLASSRTRMGGTHASRGRLDDGGWLGG